MGKLKDPHLLGALKKAYAARAKLFHISVAAAQIDLLFAEVDAVDSSSLDWSRSDLGVSVTALARVHSLGAESHQVFAHPGVIESHPHLIAYYRNLVAVSRKGISQILFPVERFEARRRATISTAQAGEICQTLNQILSQVIDEVPAYSLQIGRHAILAEIGTEIQGTWANQVGRGASKAVEDLLAEYVSDQCLGQHPKKRVLLLNNGWRIVFAPEPDVAFVDAAGVNQIAIEIKGSLDKNGAQTRYGEAKKTFAKELAKNPRCQTIYLASCFTDAVIRQIQADGQVREWYNLTSILYDASEKSRFLGRVFHIVHTPL